MTAPGRLFDGVVESIGWGVTQMPVSQETWIARRAEGTRLGQAGAEIPGEDQTFKGCSR